MFCSKCGKKFYGKAKFCSNCGESVAFFESSVKRISKTNLEERELKKQKMQEAVKQMNRVTLDKMKNEVQELEDRKGFFVAIYTGIMVVSSILSFIGFGCMGGELTSDTLSYMLLGLISAAVFLGVLFGTFINNARFNKIIEEKKRKIESFKRDNDLR